MRRILLVAALVCASIPGTAAAKPKFPYIAYIAADDAPLRSGPGEEHYPTDRLERGTKVEVHRHDPGAWYAVRPLPGSFSWVPARQVEMTDEADVAEVTAADVVAWVGTRVGQAGALKWQVELKKGELVEVLGARRMALSEEAPEETCYKIAPPPGEFRWIQSRYVTRRGADELVEETEPVGPTGQSADQTKFDSAVKPAALEAPIDGAKDAAPPTESGPKFDGFVPRKKRTVALSETTPTPSSFSPSTPALRAAPDQPAPPVGEESLFETRLRELDVELSLAVASEPASWNLAPLRQKTAALMDSGQTALERGRARLLLEKIDEFAEFARRRPIGAASASTVSTSVATENKPAENKPKSLIDATSAAVGSGVRPAPFAPDIEPRYDGIGWLMQVHSQTRSTPSYALLDKEGRVVQYVTPAPGLNLHRYLRTQVGIYGQRGYVPQLRTPHLTAQRVVSLERHKR